MSSKCFRREPGYYHAESSDLESTCLRHREKALYRLAAVVLKSGFSVAALVAVLSLLVIATIPVRIASPAPHFNELQDLTACLEARRTQQG